MLRYAVTILLSAFLLFQVQPLIAKRILPWFGGSPAVWTTCMLFFQVLLLAGYTYAHWLSRLKGRQQLVIHALLLVAACAVLPIEPDVSWKPTDSEAPSMRILLLLAATVGLPYLLLSTTGPLVQRWFGETHPGVSPYRLFALSNTGSLIALLSYPVMFEPYMLVHSQILTWSVAYVVFALLCLSCAWQIRSATFQASMPAPPPEPLPPAEPLPPQADAATPAAPVDPTDEERPSRATLAMWIGLAAFASISLLATTNQMCQEVAVVPFLWVVPLSLYLLTFIICFENERWYSRPVFGLMLWLTSLLAVICMFNGSKVGIALQILIYSAAMFACCMTCHGELAKSKPGTRHLTLFYLAVSVGGALGGVFVVAIAPRIFPQYWEYHFGLLGCAVMTLIAYYRASDWVLYKGQPRAVWVGLLVVLGLMAYSLIREATVTGSGIIARSRNFYGVLTVLEKEDTQHGYYKELRHGRTGHGFQFTDEDKRTWPTSYYGEVSGVGLSIEQHPRRLSGQPLHIAVIGLGTGTLATYGQPQDRVRYYEINPDVVEAAQTHFTFLKQCPADVQVVVGDARVMLERELAETGSQQFHVLAVDAFSSDAIPMHLLTEECFAVYDAHLAKDGILAIHISNHYLDLKPVVKTLADRAGMLSKLVKFSTGGNSQYSSNTWVVVTRNEQFFEHPVVAEAISDFADDTQELVWTDDFGSLWPIMANTNIFKNIIKLIPEPAED